MSSQFKVPSGVTPGATTGPRPGEKLVQRAWVSLVFYPLSFLAAFVVGEVMMGAVFGYSEDETMPFWPGLATIGLALLVFALPGIFAVLYGGRAVRLGNRSGMAPAVIGAVIVLGVVAVNVVAGLVS